MTLIKHERVRRYKIFQVTPELLLNALFSPAEDGTTVAVEGLPSGVEICDVTYDFERRAFLFRAWHESFEIIHENCVIPWVHPTIHVRKRGGT